MTTENGTDFDPVAHSNAVLGLAAFDEEFERVPAADDEVPDGKYLVRIDTVRLDRSQKGDPMIKWNLLVVEGPQANRRIFKNAVVTHATLPFVKGDLKTLGVEMTKLSELPDRLADLVDQTVEVTKRTKGEYTNVYFSKRPRARNGAASNGRSF